MARFAVDASVAAKWSLSEDHSENARALLGRGHELIAPDFVMFELTQVMVKTMRRGEISRQDAVEALHELEELLQLRAARPLLFTALEFALTLGLTLYDALYLTLAVQEECPLITADRRLFAAVQPNLPEAVEWVANISID